DGEILAWSYLPEEDDGELGTVEVRAPSPVPAPQSQGRALPFSALQQRLGRKKVSDKLMREVPVAYLVFDVLYAGGELVIDRPLRERAEMLDELLKTVNHSEHRVTRRKAQRNIGHGTIQHQESLNFASAEDDNRGPMADFAQTPAIIRAPAFQVSSPEDLNKLFDEAQARGNEG